MLPTQTITTQTPTPAHWVVNLNSVEDNYSNALFRLKEILLLYAGEGDSLSFSLRDWGLQWLVLFPENGSITEEEVFAKTKQQFNALKRILANPLDPQRTLVKKPLFDGKWVWEKRDYRIYCRICPSGLSPFTRLPFIASPHPFAKALLAWVDNLPKLGFPSCDEMTAENIVSTVHHMGSFSLNQASGNGRAVNTSRVTSFQSILNRSIQLGSALENDQNAVLQLVAYQALAKQACLQLQLQLTEDDLASIANEAEQTVIGLRELLQQEADRARQYVIQQRQMLEERLLGVENDYKQAAGMLENEVKGLQVQLDQALENAHQNSETVASLEAQIAQNTLERIALHERQQQQQRELRECLESEIAEHFAVQQIQQQRHQQQTDQIIAEQTHLREQQQQLLDQRLSLVEQQNRMAESRLNAQICMIQQEKEACIQNIQNLAATLAGQETIISQQQQNQQRLDAQILNQAQQYAGLNTKGHKHKTKSCAIQ